MRYVVIFALLFFVHGSVFAQTNKIVDVSQVQVLPGKYRGDTPTDGRVNVLLLTIEKVDGNMFTGTMQFYRGDYGCRRVFPAIGDLLENELVTLHVTKDVTPGCGRTYELKIVPTGFQGTWKGRNGVQEVKFYRD